MNGKKRITVSSAKAKGRRLQQFFAQKISELTGIPYGKDELIESREMGQAGGDIKLIGKAREVFPFSCECKSQETWSVSAWVEQAKANKMPGTDWLLIAKKSGSDPIVMMDVDTFFRLLKAKPTLNRK
jgi:hypothetical protein